MPTASQHSGKATRNRAFLATIDLDDYPEWAATAAFYAALHAVERLRRRRGEGGSGSHRERKVYVWGRANPIFAAYSDLQEASEMARYDSFARFVARYPSATVRDLAIDTWLAAIETYVEAEIAQLDANP